MKIKITSFMGAIIVSILLVACTKNAFQISRNAFKNKAIDINNNEFDADFDSDLDWHDSEYVIASRSISATVKSENDSCPAIDMSQEGPDCHSTGTQVDLHFKSCKSGKNHLLTGELKYYINPEKAYCGKVPNPGPNGKMHIQWETPAIKLNTLTNNSIARDDKELKIFDGADTDFIKFYNNRFGTIVFFDENGKAKNIKYAYRFYSLDQQKKMDYSVYTDLEIKPISPDPQANNKWRVNKSQIKYDNIHKIISNYAFKDVLYHEYSAHLEDQTPCHCPTAGSVIITSEASQRSNAPSPTNYGRNQINLIKTYDFKSIKGCGFGQIIVKNKSTGEENTVVDVDISKSGLCLKQKLLKYNYDYSKLLVMPNYYQLNFINSESWVTSMPNSRIELPLPVYLSPKMNGLSSPVTVKITWEHFKSFTSNSNGDPSSWGQGFDTQSLKFINNDSGQAEYSLNQLNNIRDLPGSVWIRIPSYQGQAIYGTAFFTVKIEIPEYKILRSLILGVRVSISQTPGNATRRISNLNDASFLPENSIATANGCHFDPQYTDSILSFESIDNNEGLVIQCLQNNTGQITESPVGAKLHFIPSYTSYSDAFAPVHYELDSETKCTNQHKYQLMRFNCSGGRRGLIYDSGLYNYILNKQSQ